MDAFQDLSLLKAFVCIVESESISAGARRLKISQPTLSRYLRALEEKCGATLLRRDTHGMALTQTGHRVLGDARMMLSFAEDAEQRLRDDQQELRGHLRLFATIDFGQSIFTRLISSFLQINPKVTVELGYNNRPLHMIQEGCDAGLIAGDLTDDSVVARSTGHVTRRLTASPAFVKSRPAVRQPSDLKSWPWLALAGAHFGGSKTVTLYHGKRSNETLHISPVLISEGVTSLREAALAGLGVTILPDWLAKDDLASGRLVCVLPSWRVENLPVHVVYSSQRILPVRVRAFIDYSIAYMLAEFREG